LFAFPHVKRENTSAVRGENHGFPDRDILESLLRRYKANVTAYEKPHRYHFGTHDAVERAAVHEYLIVGDKWKPSPRSLRTLSTACG
jgi:hypothetical protein